jgi:hypothetical protein
VSEPAPPTTTGISTVCNSISPNYCPVDYHTNSGYGGKLQERAIEDATVAEGEVEDREEVVDPYSSNTNTDHANHDIDNGLLALGEGVTTAGKSGVNHHQNIILQDEEGELVALGKRRCIRLREDTLHISDSDRHRTAAGNSSHQQQQGASEAESHVSFLDLRVIQEQGRFVNIETTRDSRPQDIANTALYDGEGVKQAAGGSGRYHVDQLTAAPNSNHMPYSTSSSPPNNLEDLCMRQEHRLLDNSSAEHSSTGNVALTAQSSHGFQIHGQGMRIRSDALPFGTLFPHLTANKILTEQHFSAAPQVLSFGIQDSHQNRGNEDIDKSRSHHHHNQINGIDDVIHASLKPEEEVNSPNDSRSERNRHHPHHQYLLSRAGVSPQHAEQEEYLQGHEQSSPETRRNGRSTSPAHHHLQHQRNVILSRTEIDNSSGGGGGGVSGGGGRTPLLGNSSLSSGTGSTTNNSSSNATSFTHLTTLQPPSSSPTSPLALGASRTAEDGGGGNGSVLHQLSPAGDDETNETRGMYATTPTSALEHHHHQHHHLSGLHHTTGFHPHDAVSVSSASALMHSPATNLSR